MPTRPKRLPVLTDEEYMDGSRCPYCDNPSVFLESSSDLYGGIDYGPVYVCAPCRAYVGCHPGTHTALGRLADSQLRAWKKHVHDLFDPLWKEAERRGRSRSKARKAAYAWLGARLQLTPERCHIGMMDVEMCKAACRVLNHYYLQLRRSKEHIS